MRFGISNLVFGRISQATQDAVLEVSEICDFAPTVHYGSWKDTPTCLPQIPYVGKHTQICALQSLYFGVQGASLVKDSSSFEKLLDHHAQLLTLAESARIPYLIFGSPGSRSGRLASTSDLEIHSRIVRLADMAAAKNIKICFEVNSPKFGCEFLSNNEALFELLDDLNHPGLGLHLDVGQIQEEGLDAVYLVNKHKSKLNHLHLSAPDFTCKPEMTPLYIQVIKTLADKNVDIVLEVQTLGESSEIDFIDMCRNLATICRS